MKKFYMRSGAIIDFDLPRLDSIPLEDILYSLAREYRFHGQSTCSVLRHLLMTGQTAVRLGMNSLLVKHCYFHDFTEAFVRDVPSTMKGSQFLEMEKEIYSKLLSFLNIPALSLDDHDTLKQVDLHTRLVEAYYSFDDIGLYEEILKEVTVDPKVLMEATVVWNELIDMELIDEDGEVSGQVIELFKDVLTKFNT